MQIIVINTIKCSEVILLESIVYCCAEGAYTRIHLSNKRSIYCSKNLSWFESKVASKFFIRLHRSYLVNLNYVSKIIKKEKKVVLSSGEHVPIAQRRTKHLWESIYQLEER